jgi:dGTP triphosphohydrolase
MKFGHFIYSIEKSNSTQKRKRIVIDLIAGMTEPQAIATYSQMMGVQSAMTLESIV